MRISERKSTNLIYIFVSLLSFFVVSCSTLSKQTPSNGLESYLYPLDFKSPTEIQLKIKECEMTCSPEEADLARTLTDVLSLEQRSRNQAPSQEAPIKKSKKKSKAKASRRSEPKSDLKEQMQVVQVFSAKLAPLCERFRDSFKDKAVALNWAAGLCLPFIDTPAKDRFYMQLSNFRGKAEQDVALSYRLARYALESGKPYVEIEGLVNECLKLDPAANDCLKLMSLVKDKFWALNCNSNDLDKSFLFLPVSDRQTKNLTKTVITDDRVVFGDPNFELGPKQISKVSLYKSGKNLVVAVDFFASKTDWSKQLKKAGSSWGIMSHNQLSVMGAKQSLDASGMKLSVRANQTKLENEFKKICTKN